MPRLQPLLSAISSEGCQDTSWGHNWDGLFQTFTREYLKISVMDGWMHGQADVSHKYCWMHNFSFTKMHLKTSSAKWRLFCPGGDELNHNVQYTSYIALLDKLFWMLLVGMTDTSSLRLYSETLYCLESHRDLYSVQFKIPQRNQSGTHQWSLTHCIRNNLLTANKAREQIQSRLIKRFTVVFNIKKVKYQE